MPLTEAPRDDAPTLCPVCQRPAGLRGRVAHHPLLHCPQCRLEFLAPQPSDAELNAIYGRAYYDAWGIKQNEAAVRAMKQATFRRRIDALASTLTPGARILDVGCATGYFLEVARDAGLDPFGVELSEFGATTCAEKFGTGRIHHGELEDAHFAHQPSTPFDAIFMSDLIEHVRDPARTLTAARGLLKPGGRLVITTPWTATLSRRCAGHGWLHYKPEHLFYFGPDNMQRLLAANGFTIENVAPARKCLTLGYAETQFRSSGTGMQAVAALLRRLPARLLHLPLWLSIGEATVIATSSP